VRAEVIYVKKFVERLNDLNLYLLYFSEENPKQLDQDEIIEIWPSSSFSMK
jgi:hypothetical protein